MCKISVISIIRCVNNSTVSLHFKQIMNDLSETKTFLESNAIFSLISLFRLVILGAIEAFKTQLHYWLWKLQMKNEPYTARRKL